MSKFAKEVLKPGYSLYFPFGSERKIDIQPTANAWWADQAKVHQFLIVIGMDCTIAEACIHSGITIKQYKYFQKLYPEFKELMDAYKALQTLRARQTIAEALDKPKMAMRYLETFKPDEFGKTKRVKNQGLKDWEQKHGH